MQLLHLESCIYTSSHFENGRDFIRLKKNKCYVSKLLTDWKTWPKCVFFNSFFFSEQQMCQIWVVHSFEIWNLILDEQDTRQNTDLNKSVFQSVSLCLSYLSLYILTSKFIKYWKKNSAGKKNSNFEFCWIKRALKNKCARQLWDIGFMFFSLI